MVAKAVVLEVVVEVVVEVSLALTHTPEHWPLTGDTGRAYTGVEAEEEWEKMMMRVTEDKSGVRLEKKAVVVMMMMRRSRKRREKQEKEDKQQVMHDHKITRVKDACAL